MKKGIDISYHQKNIDFASVKSQGIEFAIIREGYRNTTDPKFFEYVEESKEKNIQILGVYHFSYALNEKQAIEEAQFCIKNMKRAGLKDDIIVFYDFEYDTVKKAAQKGIKLSKAECNKHTLAFCEEIKRLGFIPGVYTNKDYYKNWYNKDLLNKYYIWLADYSGSPDFECLIQQYSNVGQVSGINGNVDLDYFYDEKFKMEDKVMRSRDEVIKLGNSWIGKKESDGSYKIIIDIYNSFNGPLPRGIRMKYEWSWCACTWSALAIALGYTDIMPIEISCGELIKQAKNMGIWKENDGYIPSPADAILYDWDDKGSGDNTGWPDHVGIIEYVNKDSGYMTVIEGNYSNAVKKRTISINGRYIRGFIAPKYDNNIVDIPDGHGKDVKTLAYEVIAGIWGSGENRKKALESYGYDYSKVQAKVNEILNMPKEKPIATESGSNKKISTTCRAKKYSSIISGTYITTADLYCRNDAGTNKKALCCIPKGTKVKNYGYYTNFNGVKWLLIQFTLNGIQYTGFSSSKYLKK